MRAFIAIDLPEKICRAVGEWQAEFRASCEAGSQHPGEIRWTRAEGFHLTLKFLGHVPDDRINRVIEVLKPLCGFQKFSVEVKGFGFFPNAHRPRVLWVGVKSPSALQDLAQRLEAAMEGVGFVPEQRSFTPHLTLARFKSPRPQPGLEELLKQRGDASLGQFDVSEFVLFESKLSPHGAKYKKVATFPCTPRPIGVN